MSKIKLVEAIAELRSELYKANKAGAEEALKLEIEAIDVEFEVEFEKHGEVGGEVKFDVYVAEAKLQGGGNVSSKQSHRVRLHLKPTMNGKSNLPVGDRAKREDD